MSKSKWEIKGLSSDLPFGDSAKIILSDRLSNLLNAIDIFFKNDTEENLHDIRIALRRLRYNMELFTCCFEGKKFSSFYKIIERLQDQSGLLRDLDVLKVNINSLITNEKLKISGKIFKKIEEKRSELKAALKLELMKFTHRKALKNFNSLIS
ncbi:MAG: CHAD domain-containing protein [Ignavibacteriaceae bacterium]